VVDLIERIPADFRLVYDDDDTLWEKMNKVAKTIYGASDVTADSKVRAQIKMLQSEGYGHYPVCVAKTQYSFSTDPIAARRPVGARRQHPRGSPCRRRRVRRDDLRRRDDRCRGCRKSPPRRKST
jgi:hypothetical protein